MVRSAPSARTRLQLFFLSFVLLLGAAAGCSDSVDNDTVTSDAPVGFEADLDPGSGEFILKELDPLPPEYQRLRLQLIARDLTVDASGSTVRVEVAIRNLSERDLYPDLIVWLADFLPESVMPINADLIPPADSSLAGPITAGPWGFVYSELLGDDGALSPRETSGFKEWVFHDPDLRPFSFGASVEFSLQPASSILGGTVFNDVDADGLFDADESGIGAGFLFADGPGRDATAVIRLREDGRYGIPVKHPGLYTLTYIPPPTLAPFAPIVFTTPNPLEVLLPPGPDGLPTPFLDANFGVHSPNAPIGLVKITDRNPADIPTDPYHLGSAQLRGTILILDELGFSGCSGGHPFDLYMAGGFAESNPVQATLVLSHDDLGELCDAYFEERRYFELAPIVALYREMYDGGEGIRLRLVTPGGTRELFLEF